MPVEIKELVIKATVEEASGGGNSGGNAAPDAEAIVQVCIDRVLEILKEQKER